MMIMREAFVSIGSAMVELHVTTGVMDEVAERLPRFIQGIQGVQTVFDIQRFRKAHGQPDSFRCLVRINTEDLTSGYSLEAFIALLDDSVKKFVDESHHTLRPK